MNKKPWYASKAIWLAIIQAGVGVLTAVVTTNPELQSVGILAIIKSCLDIAIRMLTEQPIA